jgi:hypothetical protein
MKQIGCAKCEQINKQGCLLFGGHKGILGRLQETIQYRKNKQIVNKNNHLCYTKDRNKSNYKCVFITTRVRMLTSRFCLLAESGGFF